MNNLRINAVKIEYVYCIGSKKLKGMSQNKYNINVQDLF